jgi:hypothetical protein
MGSDGIAKERFVAALFEAILSAVLPVGPSDGSSSRRAIVS